MACKMDWKKLPMSLTELCIDTTLRCGQSFRWRQDADKVWSCALHGRILSLRQDSEHLHYRAIYPSIPPITSAPSSEPSQVAPSIPRNDEGTLALIKHYFNLEHNLTQLYEEWASADTNFKKKAPKFTGVRILRQDAWEALVGFICSSNNNIQRISQMVEKLCLNYGPLVGHVGSQPFHDFPSVEALTDPQVEQHLRQLGFGYRAKYLYQTAVIVQDKPPGWLEGLRNPETRFDHTLRQSAGEFIAGGREGYREAHEELLQLQGVGPKVADCVSLMGLGWGESVPVDTHVWQIAQRDYRFGKGKHSSLTKATYDAVANKFRSLWGKEAGWAHSVLFTADLKAFSERLVKAEVKEEQKIVEIKREHEVEVQDIASATVVLDQRVKRRLEEDEQQVMKVEETKVRRVRRQRKR